MSLVIHIGRTFLFSLAHPVRIEQQEKQMLIIAISDSSVPKQNLRQIFLTNTRSAVVLHGVGWLRSINMNVQERQAGINVYKPILADVDDKGSEFNLFLQDEWQLHSKLALNVGGHYLYQHYREEGIQRYEVGPRVALAVKPTKHLVLRGAWGIYHQPVHLMGIPVEDGIETVGRAEQAVHYILGFEYTPVDSFLVRVEGYYNTFDNLVGRLREFGRQNQVYNSPESGDARGVDVVYDPCRIKPFDVDTRLRLWNRRRDREWDKTLPSTRSAALFRS